MTGVDWTPDEDRILRNMAAKVATKVIAQTLGRSHLSVRDRASRLGIKLAKQWTERDDEYLRANAGKLPYRDLCKRLGRGDRSIRHRLRFLGLAKAQKALSYEQYEPEPTLLGDDNYWLACWKEGGFPSLHLIRGQSYLVWPSRRAAA